MLFPEAPSYDKKNFKINFGALCSICTSSKSVSQIFKILFQTGNIDTFVVYVVFFSRHVQIKISFSDGKNISGEIETRFSRATIKN